MNERKTVTIPTCFLAMVVVWTATTAQAEEGAGKVRQPSTALAAVAEPSPGNQLQSLDWLLGEWTGMTDNAVVLVSAHPCEGGAFIEREIVVKRAGHEDVGGTQRIGWDPVSRRIKCWTFDTLGGFGEGYWQRSGDAWVVESSEVLSDGSQSSTTTIFTPHGADRFDWHVERARVDGVSLPLQKIEFVRAKQN